MTSGGDGGIKSEETKEKMSKPKTTEHAKNISKGRKGIKFTEEHLKNMSKSQLGKKASEETREKMRNKIVTQESNLKRSKALKGRPNPLKSSTIKIYNSDGDLQYTSTENFKNFCEDNKLPYSVFIRSYQNNTKLYENIKDSKKRSLEKNGLIKFQYWYAVKDV